MSNLYADRPLYDMKGNTPAQIRKITDDTLSRMANALTGLVSLLEAHPDHAISSIAALVKNIEDDAWQVQALIPDIVTKQNIDI